MHRYGSVQFYTIMIMRCICIIRAEQFRSQNINKHDVRSTTLGCEYQNRLCDIKNKLLYRQMINRQSFENKSSTKNLHQRKSDKQNQIQPRTQRVVSKDKQKQTVVVNNNINIARQTDRSRGISNKQLNNNLSPKKFINPHDKFVAYNSRSALQQQQPQRANVQKQCQNHKGKPAKYKITSDEDTLNYCEKCAIFLASQGFAVCKIQNSNQPNNNKNGQVKDKSMIADELEVHVNFVLKNLEQKQESLKKKINEAEEYKKEIQNNLQTYFTKVVQTILEKKKQFIKFVEIQHDKVIQRLKEHQVELQKAILESFEIRSEIAASQLSENEKNYLKNQIKTFRIMCQKLDVVKCEKKDIVTVDINEILETINEKFKIKVRRGQDDTHFEIRNSSDEDDQDKKEVKVQSIGESQIKTIDKFSLFSSQENFD